MNIYSVPTKNKSLPRYFLKEKNLKYLVEFSIFTFIKELESTRNGRLNIFILYIG